MDLLGRGISQFVIQTVFHSVIIIIVVEALISLWHIRKPSLQIKFRFLALLLPVIYLPVYFLLFPARSDAGFYERSAIINFNRWLELRLVWGLSVWQLFLVVLGLTVFFFVFREAIPIVRYFLRSRLSHPGIPPGQFPRLDRALASLAGKNYFVMPRVLLSAEAVPSVYKFTHKALAISAMTIDMLDDDELEAVIAHEFAHLSGQSYRLIQISLVLRFLMFYNPVALFIFRRIISDVEKDCDDIAVNVTGKRLALASGLLRVYRQTSASPGSSGSGWGRFVPRLSNLENQFQFALIKERAERLAHEVGEGELPFTCLRMFFMVGALLALLFYVV